MEKPFTILKQLKDNEDNYLPTVTMYSYLHRRPYEIEIHLELPTDLSDSQWDMLRLALSYWAKQCHFKKLAEGNKYKGAYGRETTEETQQVY